MGFMDLWIVPDPNKKKESNMPAAEEQPAASVSKTTTFPTTASTPVTVVTSAPVIGSTNCEPHMEAVMQLYEKGFDSLDKPGVEFFEYFKAVANAGIDNKDAYTMAFNMLSGLEKTMTKDSLIEQSQYYLDEIMKVHEKFARNGLTKKDEIAANKSTEDAQLNSDIKALEEQRQVIDGQIEAKTRALQQINAKYDPSIEEVGCKMAANDLAKERIVGTLLRVVENIRKNL